MLCKITSIVLPFFVALTVYPELCKSLRFTTREEQRDERPALRDREGAALKMASFNVQVFGAKKMENQLVQNVLVQIILRYDIILIQEIRSTIDGPIDELLEHVNRKSSGVYKMALSPRLGRTVSKEQYAFLYRSDKVSVKDGYVFDDGDESTKMDKFQREPFIVRFESQSSYVTDFAMAAIHTSPDEAVSEIDRLVDVYDDIVRQWNLTDVMILGDFNSGCSYVSKSAWAHIRLATDRRFYWLFSDDVDTTVAKSDCPYDRMVIAGENMKRGVFADTAKVFRFDQAFDLTEDETEDVSDHFPIEIQLKDSTYRDEEQHFDESVTFTNKDKSIKPLSKSSIFALRSPKYNQLLSQGYSLRTVYTKTGKIDEIIIGKSVHSAETARKAIEDLGKYHPSKVSPSQVAVCKRQVAKLSQFGDASCSAMNPGEYVYQMLSNECSGKKAPEISEVMLICSPATGSCKMNIRGS